MVRHFQVLHFQSTRSEEVATAVTAVSLPVNAMKFRAADLFPRVNKLINDKLVENVETTVQETNCRLLSQLPVTTNAKQHYPVGTQ